ncbi:MAG: hypothetical protein EHM93_00745 [Bacteroidales bacterium]|nr:MAG: hypothetical protein EHM93_00745 [Bacteroidales bacterium]
MKILKKLLFSFAMLLMLSLTSKAQENVTDLLSGSLIDANTLAKAYLEPFGKGFGASLNSGWYNTAKPHKLGGFDITFTIATAVPPSSAKTFDVSKLNLNYWELQTPANNLSPTVSGAKEDGSILIPQTTVPGITPQLTLPQGANLKFIPAPMIQAGIGLPFNTEVDFRILPKIKIPDTGEFSLWGFGIKNEFKEFIPGLKAVPINISAFFGYTKFKSSFDAEQSGNANSNQKLNFDASGYTTRLLISKSIPVLTIYAGVGYSKTTTNVDLKGNYNLPINGVNTTVTDPIALDFINKGMSANLGLRIKLAIIAFHFDYTFGQYKIYNAGFGINFR